MQKKSFFQHPTATASHCTKANVQLQISSATTYCELAVQQSIFEKYQSCVCTTVTLSHRFKAFSPLFCAKNRFRLVLPENSAEIYFDRALNRGSQDGAVSPHMVALLTSVRNSPCFGGLRRTKTCHRQLFARPSSIPGGYAAFLLPAATDRRSAACKNTPDGHSRRA